ncbi:MAG: nucleotide-binding protein [Pseudonocardiaceae bacterium]
MKIFIGSSRESLELAKDIALWLEERDHEAIIWDQPGLFLPGEQTMRILIDISRRVDAAVLVFGPDDRGWYRGDTVLQPRDNVLIEYGLFAGALGPQKAIVCSYGDTKHPVDLAGLTYIDLSLTRRDRGKLDLSIWARRLTTSPIDPAVLRLKTQVAELEVDKDRLTQILGFETDKIQDLAEILRNAKVADFLSYNLDTDGHWKLLFDYIYFQFVAVQIAKAAMSPVELQQLFVDAGAEAHSTKVAWHNPGDPERMDPDRNSHRNEFLSRKVLRLLRRDSSGARTYLSFVRNLPLDLSERIDTAARDAIVRLGAAR